ncbi:hypothetical protein [Streptomyces sp. LN245]|uniref:hypothetical protein n=1 Tax=Streptomyces sp. LN245 TaxID=3112975 RepID=UPI0037226F93
MSTVMLALPLYALPHRADASEPPADTGSWEAAVVASSVAGVSVGVAASLVEGVASGVDAAADDGAADANVSADAVEASAVAVPSFPHPARDAHRSPAQTVATTRTRTVVGTLRTRVTAAMTLPSPHRATPHEHPDIRDITLRGHVLNRREVLRYRFVPGP